MPKYHLRGFSGMKSKSLAVIVLSAIAIAVVFSATVMAGQGQPIQSWLEVLVMNTPDNPVPVDVQGMITLDDTDPVAVDVQGTVPVEVQGAVEVDDSTPISVAVEGPVEVEGTVDFEGTIDVSGWLHTTDAGQETVTSYEIPQIEIVGIQTDGYRQVTIRIEAEAGSDLHYRIFYYISGYPGCMWSDSIGVAPVPANGITLTIDVVSTSMAVWFYNPENGDTGVSATVWWFLTT